MISVLIAGIIILAVSLSVWLFTKNRLLAMHAIVLLAWGYYLFDAFFISHKFTSPLFAIVLTVVTLSCVMVFFIDREAK